MPKLKEIAKCKHPNSRKTTALMKQIKKTNSRAKAKLHANVKLNFLGEKVLWFRDNAPDVSECTAEQTLDLVNRYMSRFDEELEQIRIKHSIGNRKNRQHASREDIIGMTIKGEREEFNGCGLEIPDVLNPAQFDLLKKWNGELRFLQNFKLRRISKKILEAEIRKLNAKLEMCE